uniref:Uncharacterized protein n=1 Tax=Sipha flava TaxID=143950 RepID=A0A2S2QGR4_9HEMI
MTIDLASNISNAIIMSFPTEIKDVYFLKDVTCKAPKGKVYVKYFNTMKKLKNGGLKSGNNNTSEVKKIIYRSEDLLNSSLDIEPDSEDMALTLLNNNDLSWPEIEVIWRKTINFRRQYIRNNDTASIFSKWVHYTKPMGYKLIEIDFGRMYTNFKNLNVKFEKTLPTLLSILHDRVKDGGSVALLRQLKESTNLCKNGETLTSLYLLHSLFLPTTKRVTLDEQGKKINNQIFNKRFTKLIHHHSTYCSRTGINFRKT